MIKGKPESIENFYPERFSHPKNTCIGSETMDPSRMRTIYMYDTQFNYDFVNSLFLLSLLQKPVVSVSARVIFQSKAS